MKTEHPLPNTLYVNYTIKGDPIPDHLAEKWILNQADICVNGQSKEFQVSTENVINAVRAMKLNNKITCNLQIMFEGEVIPMNEYCKIDDWPKGFCDYDEHWVCEILSAQLKKRKNIGVICVDSDDFLHYRELRGFDNGSIGTNRKFIHNNITYWKIADVCDLCSLTLDDIVETLWAKKNPHYDEIIHTVQSNLIVNK